MKGLTNPFFEFSLTSVVLNNDTYEYNLKWSVNMQNIRNWVVGSVLLTISHADIIRKLV